MTERLTVAVGRRAARAILIDDRGSLAGVDLRPAALKEFIMANREALLAEAAVGN